MARLTLPINTDGRSTNMALINCHAEPSPGKGPITLIGSAGVSSVATFPATPYRGAAYYDGTLYAVSGAKLYSISRPGTVTEVGDIAGSGRVSMAANRDALVIGTSSTDYVYDGTLTAITDADFVDASIVDVIDSFAVWVRPGTDQIASSGLADSDSYDALDFATAESKPDKLVSLIVDHNQLILFGEDTTEVWWNAGLTGFPFERIPNGVIEHGCISARSVAKADSGVFWLDDDLIVRRLNGIQAVKISSFAIDERIRKRPNPDNAYGFTYTEDGHIFYALTFDDMTLVYDAATNEWFERQSLGFDNWRIQDVVTAYNRQYAFAMDRVGILDEGVYTEFGDEIRTSWRYQTVYAQGRSASHKRLEIMLNVGEANISESSVIGLRVSDDDGKTWEELPTRSVGLTGEYVEAPIWTKLGSSRNRVYEPWITSNIRRFAVDTQLEVAGGRL